MLEAVPILEFSGGLATRQREPLPDDWFSDVEILVVERIDGGLFDVEASWEIDEWPTPGRMIRYRGGGLAADVRPGGGEARD